MQHVCLICQPFSSPLIPLCLQGCFSPGIWSLMWFRTLYQMNRDQRLVHHYEKRAIQDCSRFVKCCIIITQSDLRFLISFRGVSQTSKEAGGQKILWWWRISTKDSHIPLQGPQYLLHGRTRPRGYNLQGRSW